jgi:hypothetical protein
LGAILIPLASICFYTRTFSGFSLACQDEYPG